MDYSNNVQNRILYGLLVVASIFLLITAMGGGLIGSGNQNWMVEWQHQAFSMLCHQDPSRSFWINGQPMAVCSRCFGIYLALALTLLGVPFLGYPVRKFDRYKKYILLCAVLVNILDVLGNLFGFWQNTLLSRFVLGTMIGFSVIFLFAKDFLDAISETKGKIYELYASR